MSDDESLGDYFRDVRSIKQQKRESNRTHGAELLKLYGIAFTEKNDGAHLIVRHDDKVVDYWPGTGKFIFRQGNNKGRGVFTLLKRLGIQAVNQRRLTMSTITALETRKREYQSQISQEEERHKKTLEALKWEAQETQTQINMLCGGLDMDKILHAEHLLIVNGQFKNAGSEKGHALKVAMDAILAGGGSLFECYVGTKDYDRWHGQFVNPQYGFGPSHGSVLFSIELARPIRTARQPLTADQIEDCLYYLNNLVAIQDAKQRAKS